MGQAPCAKMCYRARFTEDLSLNKEDCFPKYFPECSLTTNHFPFPDSKNELKSWNVFG